MTHIQRYQEYSYGVEETVIGEFVKYDDHAAIVAVLQEQVQKLAAENLNRQHLLDMIGETGNANFGKTRIETPATDAVIREIEANAELEGMVKGAGRVALEASQVYRVAPQNSDERSLHKTIGNFAHMVARRIRAGAQPND